MINIKRADLTDDEAIDEIIYLDGQAFGGSAPPLLETDCYGYWWMAWCDERYPVAYAALAPAANTERTGYLKRCGVIGPWRGQGLQARLIRVREKHARKLGWQRLVTDTTDNVRSSNTLIRCGYRLFRPEHKWAFEHSNYWEKKLA